MGQSASCRRTFQPGLGWANEAGPSLQWAKEAILTGGHFSGKNEQVPQVLSRAKLIEQEDGTILTNQEGGFF